MKRASPKAARYEQALADLEYPATFCRAAKTLARLGERRAILPLLRAYEMPVEVSKVCLLDALEALGGREEAHGLYESGDANQRRMAVRLMELLPAEEHLPWLARAVMDPEETVRRQARRALVCQRRTAAWEQTLARLLEVEDRELRALAIQGLSGRTSAAARQALQSHFARETDAGLKEQLVRTLAESVK